MRLLGFNNTDKVYQPITVDDTTGGLVTDLDLSTLATQATLAAIDAKVTNCDTSGLALDATLATGVGHLATLAAGVVSDVFQVSTGTLLFGDHNNLADDVTINAGADSSAVDISDMKVANLYYEDSLIASTDGVDVMVSVDGTNYVKIYELFPFAGPLIRSDKAKLDLHGYTSLLLTNNSPTDNYTNVQAFVVGQS